MSLIKDLSSQPNARGLVIIITNDYTAQLQPKLPSDHPKLDPLPGTKIDGQNMSKAFSELQFMVHWEQNISIDKFTELIHQATSYREYTRFKRYKCVVFVFSGHGDEGDLVYLQDGSQVSIGEQIIAPFLPKESPNIGKFQKLFLFDTCRGKENTSTVDVPKGQNPKGKMDESRGVTVIDKIRVPDEGGFLVAYSTMPKHRAWEKAGKGGAWLERVARKIRESRSSIEDVLTEVNGDLIQAGLRNAQQPEKLSRLNGVVYLHPDKDDLAKQKKPMIAAVFPVTSGAQAEGEQGEQENVFITQLITQYPAAHFQDHCHKPQEYGSIPYFRSLVTITVGWQQVVGDSLKYFVSTELSRGEAAKNALLQIAELRKSPCSQPVLNPMPLQGTTASPVKLQQGVPRSATTPTYKEQMQTFFQSNKINPQFEFQSDSTTTDRTRYRCIVRYTINGSQRKIDSGHYYFSKVDAKDQVAKLVLTRENVLPEACGSDASPSKVWKSQLKEYCDKKGKPVPTYSTAQSGTGYISTITCCDKTIQGQVCASKQEAEQSAASCALQSFQI